MFSGGFGAQGQQSSRDCAVQVGTICRAPIRVSYFVGLFLAFQLFQVLRSSGSMTTANLLWVVLEVIGVQVILLLTVLCHEFGHGNMARYFGGEISHILLWVFGGICFHTRPRQDGLENSKILRNDLLVVAAGPFTHFFQAPLWGLVLWLLFFLLAGGDPLQTTGYESAWVAFTEALHPLGGGLIYQLVWQSSGQWSALIWMLVGRAIQLNVALFLFNVFFPMYPADGAKLLVTSLMFFCGVTPRKAALVLVCFSVPCAGLMIAWGVYSIIVGGAAGIMSGLMGWMGVMSLMESNKIWELRKHRQLHTHPLFNIARSWRRRERDAFGVVHRINTTDFDDDEPLTGGGWSNLCGTGGCGSPGAWTCVGCLSCMLPCLIRPAGSSDPETAVSVIEQARVDGIASPSTPQQEEVRASRDRHLEKLEQQRSRQQKTVREHRDERYSAQNQGSPAQGTSGSPAR